MTQKTTGSGPAEPPDGTAVRPKGVRPKAPATELPADVPLGGLAVSSAVKAAFEANAASNRLGQGEGGRRILAGLSLAALLQTAVLPAAALADHVVLPGAASVSARICSAGTVADCLDSSMRVESGASARDSHLLAGGIQYVSSGGVATGTVVNGRSAAFSDSPMQVVMSGGVAFGTVASYGRQILERNGTASGTVVASGGRLEVNHGGLALGTVVGSGGWLWVEDGGSALDVVQGLGARLYHKTGGSGTITGFNASGPFSLTDGRPDDSIVQSGWLQVVAWAGPVSGTVVASGGSQSLSTGGVASSTVIRRGGTLTIGFLGGSALDVVQEPGGNVDAWVTRDSSELIVGANASGKFSLSSGKATGFIIYSGGLQRVYRDGESDFTVIEDGGVQHVGSGGLANFTVVRNGGEMQVESSGSATAAEVGSGGVLLVSSGGRLEGVVVRSGGSLFVAPGGEVASIVDSGGYIEVNSD